MSVIVRSNAVQSIAVVTVPYASSITLNASQGAVFRCVATGNVVLSNITNGRNGQQISLEVLASGADRALTVAGSLIPIPSNLWWVGSLRYNQPLDLWLLTDSSGDGGTQVSVDGAGVSTLDISSASVTAADVGAVPSTGGTIAGDVRMQNSGNTKAYRFTTSGSGVPLYYEVGGENLVFRVNTQADFAGTSHEYLRFSKDVQEMQVGGELQIRDSLGGTTVHDLNPVDGVAALGAKNGLTNLRFCGYKNTSGAPTTGTWAVGDLVLDSTKTWRLCSVAGTPGTWI